VADARPAAATETRVIRSPHRRANERSSRQQIGHWVTLALLALFGLGSGVSAIADGFYDLTVWGFITIGVAAVAVAAAATTSAKPRLMPMLAVGGLTGLWLWSWLSSTWGESTDQALLAAGRWALYAAMLAALLLLMRSEFERWLPLICATVGVILVAGYVVLRMLDGDVDALFFGGRLRDPLGYVNGQAGYFLLGFWPCVALAEQERSKALAGLGAACALVLGALLVLSQTRGVLPATAVSAVVVMALVPGRPRRIWALATIGLGLVAISAPLLDVYQNIPAGQQADPELVKAAARRILLAALAVGAAWALAQAVFERVSAGDSPSAGRLRRAERFLAAGVVAIALLAALVAVGDPVDKVRQQYDDFVNLRVQDPGSTTRFLSGGGYRYDYWRVAWLEFKDSPLRGQGAGNYDDLYFLERRTTEDIRQPHSLEMQTLAELGLVGMLFLLLFVGAAIAGLWRQSRRARQLPERRMVAVAAGGAFVAWLAHTSVDWLHNIPGVTGVALCAAAALVSPWAQRRSRAAISVRLTVVALVAVVAVVAADSVGRLAYAEKDRVDARNALQSDPVEALRLADRSLSLNDDSVPALYVKGAAYARVGHYREARAALLEAARLEPRDHLTWALLGDLAARRGEFRRARAYYRRSLALNPRNPFVRALARDPTGGR
jgi:tetratricopeptide (TPR) repeat protein